MNQLFPAQTRIATERHTPGGKREVATSETKKPTHPIYEVKMIECDIGRIYCYSQRNQRHSNFEFLIIRLILTGKRYAHQHT